GQAALPNLLFGVGSCPDSIDSQMARREERGKPLFLSSNLHRKHLRYNGTLHPRQLHQLCSSFFCCAYRRIKINPQFAIVCQQIESFAVDADHRCRFDARPAKEFTVMEQRLLVISIHVLDDPAFGVTKRVFDKHRFGLDPIDLSKSADEPRSSEADPIEREVMGFEIRFRGWEITEIAIAGLEIRILNLFGISDPGEPASRLWIVHKGIKHGQRYSVVLLDIARMLSDVAYENGGLAVIVERVGGDRSERI